MFRKVNLFFKEQKFFIFLVMLIYIIASVSLLLVLVKENKNKKEIYDTNVCKESVEKNIDKDAAKVLSSESLAKKLKLNPRSKVFYFIGSWFLLSIGIGIIVNIAWLMLFFTKDRIRYRKLEELEEERIFKNNFPFDGWFLVKGVILFVFAQCVLKDLFFYFKLSKVDLNFLTTFMGTLGLNLFIFFLLLGVMYEKKISFNALFGLKKKKLLKFCGIGVASYFAFVPVMFFLAFLSYLICDKLGIEVKPHQIAAYVAEEKSNFVLTYWFLLAVLFAPLFEEVFFRGIIYRVFLKKHSVAVSIFITSFVFSLLHFNYSQFLVILFMGIMLNLIYHKTKSLVPCMVFHILNNTVSVSMLYFVLIGNR